MAQACIACGYVSQSGKTYSLKFAALEGLTTERAREWMCSVCCCCCCWDKATKEPRNRIKSFSTTATFPLQLGQPENFNYVRFFSSKHKENENNWTVAKATVVCVRCSIIYHLYVSCDSYVLIFLQFLVRSVERTDQLLLKESWSIISNDYTTKYTVKTHARIAHVPTSNIVSFENYSDGSSCQTGSSSKPPSPNSRWRSAGAEVNQEAYRTKKFLPFFTNLF